MTDIELKNLLDARTERNPYFSYKLEEGQFALDHLVTGETEVNEREMSFWLPFADGNRRDGVGDLLEVTGIVCDRHRLNPIVLFDHGKEVKLPLAKAERRESKDYTVRIDAVSKEAGCDAYVYQGKGIFGVERDKEYDHAVFCEQIFDLWCQKYLRAGSIGYQVIQGQQLPPDPITGVPAGMHLQRILMLECSAVVLPANKDTVRKVLSMSSLCGKSLSPALVKSLSVYDTDTKTTVGFVKSSDSTVQKLKKVCESFSNLEGLGSDYQRCFWNEKDKHVWWESFDGDDNDSIREVIARLEKVPGVKKVSVEAESSPKGDDWIRVYPDKKSIEFTKKDTVPGGLADNKNPKDFDPTQLAMGIKVEMEHTDDPKVATEIAMDHLTEDPQYYTKLKKIEEKELLYWQLKQMDEDFEEKGMVEVKYTLPELGRGAGAVAGVGIGGYIGRRIGRRLDNSSLRRKNPQHHEGRGTVAGAALGAVGGYIAGHAASHAALNYSRGNYGRRKSIGRIIRVEKGMVARAIARQTGRSGAMVGSAFGEATGQVAAEYFNQKYPNRASEPIGHIAAEFGRGVGADIGFETGYGLGHVAGRAVELPFELAAQGVAAGGRAIGRWVANRFRRRKKSLDELIQQYQIKGRVLRRVARIGGAVAGGAIGAGIGYTASRWRDVNNQDDNVQRVAHTAIGSGAGAILGHRAVAAIQKRSMKKKREGKSMPGKVIRVKRVLGDIASHIRKNPISSGKLGGRIIGGATGAYIGHRVARSVMKPDDGSQKWRRRFVRGAAMKVAGGVGGVVGGLVGSAVGHTIHARQDANYRRPPADVTSRSSVSPVPARQLGYRPSKVLPGRIIRVKAAPITGELAGRAVGNVAGRIIGGVGGYSVGRSQTQTEPKTRLGRFARKVTRASTLLVGQQLGGAAGRAIGGAVGRYVDSRKKELGQVIRIKGRIGRFIRGAGKVALGAAAIGGAAYLGHRYGGQVANAVSQMRTPRPRLAPTTQNAAAAASIRRVKPRTVPPVSPVQGRGSKYPYNVPPQNTGVSPRPVATPANRGTQRRSATIHPADVQNYANSQPPPVRRSYSQNLRGSQISGVPGYDHPR